MAKKTFNIGEYCAGGVISVEITGSKIAVIQRDWDFSKGGNRASNQTKSPELNRVTVDVDDRNATRSLSDFLYNITTSYYTDKVMEYIESKAEFKQRLFW